MKLRYVGPEPNDTALPLPEGWTAADHVEPDAALAREKVASKLYAPVGKPADVKEG